MVRHHYPPPETTLPHSPEPLPTLSGHDDLDLGYNSQPQPQPQPLPPLDSTSPSLTSSHQRKQLFGPATVQTITKVYNHPQLAVEFSEYGHGHGHGHGLRSRGKSSGVGLGEKPTGIRKTRQASRRDANYAPYTTQPIPEAEMWKLSTGKFVEATLLNYARTHHCPLAASLILDIADAKMAGLFTKREWKQIRAKSIELPTVPPPMLELIESLKPLVTEDAMFDYTNTAIPRGSWGAHRIRDLVSRSVQMYRDKDLLQPHAESFYQSIWEPYLKHFTSDHHYFAPGDVSPVFYTGKTKQKLRCDALIKRRVVADDPRSIRVDYGIVEYAGNADLKKRENDLLKTGLMLRDVYVDSLGKCGGRKDVRVGLQTVGLVPSGFMMSIVRLHWAAGQTCILQRQPACKFPRTVEEFGRQAFELLREILKCQAVVQASSDLVESVLGKTFDGDVSSSDTDESQNITEEPTVLIRPIDQSYPASI